MQLVTIVLTQQRGVEADQPDGQAGLGLDALGPVEAACIPLDCGEAGTLELQIGRQPEPEQVQIAWCLQSTVQLDLSCAHSGDAVLGRSVQIDNRAVNVVVPRHQVDARRPELTGLGHLMEPLPHLVILMLRTNVAAESQVAGDEDSVDWGQAGLQVRGDVASELVEHQLGIPLVGSGPGTQVDVGEMQPGKEGFFSHPRRPSCRNRRAPRAGVDRDAKGDRTCCITG